MAYIAVTDVYSNVYIHSVSICVHATYVSPDSSWCTYVTNEEQQNITPNICHSVIIWIFKFLRMSYMCIHITSTPLLFLLYPHTPSRIHDLFFNYYSYTYICMYVRYTYIHMHTNY